MTNVAPTTGIEMYCVCDNDCVNQRGRSPGLDQLQSLAVRGATNADRRWLVTRWQPRSGVTRQQQNRSSQCRRTTFQRDTEYISAGDTTTNRNVYMPDNTLTCSPMRFHDFIIPVWRSTYGHIALVVCHFRLSLVAWIIAGMSRNCSLNEAMFTSSWCHVMSPKMRQYNRVNVH